MSDSSSIIDLEKRVDLLTKALQRQRNVTGKLQQRLSAKESVTYNDHKSLIDALTEAKSRQNQLELIAYISNDLGDTPNLKQFFKHFIEQLNNLVIPCDAIILHQNLSDAIKVEHFSNVDVSWTHKRLRSYDKNGFRFLTGLEEKKWIRINKGEHSCLGFVEEQMPKPMYLALPLSKVHNASPVIILGIEHYCYNDEFKQMLGTVAIQFADHLKKRQTEIELEHNYQKLQKALHELTTTQQQLQHSEKLAALGILSAGVAHEINNPMAFLRSNLETLTEYSGQFEEALQQHIPEDVQDEDLEFAREDVAPLIQSCIAGIERISGIVKSLKTFSKKETETFEPTNINDVIEESMLIVKNKFSLSHQINVSLSETPLTVIGDFGQLQQVFVNLFINAIHAMPDQGVLNISTAKIDKSIRVEVTDTGLGMDVETLKHLFDPFYTTKTDADQDGTGLGLSVSYAILQKHDASIDVTSKINQGSKFVITLPCE